MSEPCENLSSCPFFKEFKGNPDVVKNRWIKLFCEDKSKSEHCERKKLKKATGKAPPASMAPTGRIL
jgi:hypothetical protein